uniref:Reverse transcriptase domain-containing protein n=1 Tax=Sander lucioperca TaxID=283035 RepID=A0A8D0A5Q8_SANLU
MYNLLKPWTNTLPTSTPDLCNSFLHFFADKINIIYQSLSPVSDLPVSTPAPTTALLLPISPDLSTPLSTLPASPSYAPHCPLETVPSAFKTAAVTPILKKPGLDPSSLNNYRPISNLPFLSKTLERIVASQLQTHLHGNNQFEPLQSGFHPLHSTETALLKVLNNLLTSADTGSLNILILLDLSAAFDTVSHNILLTRLKDLGIEGTALSWLRSYLSNRSHFISLHNHTSATATVTQGVPQGSVLGPLLFIIYILTSDTPPLQPGLPLLRRRHLDLPQHQIPPQSSPLPHQLLSVS